MFRALKRIKPRLPGNSGELLRFFRIPVIYAVLGFGWIFFSDRLVILLFPNPEIQSQVQTYKGWFFILATAILLALLVKREQQHLERIVADQTKELRKANDDLRASLDILVRNERMAALGSLVAGFSHEISTPIGNALTAVTFLEDMDKNNSPKDSEDVVTMVASASRSLERAASLVRNFKTVAVDRTKEEESIFYLRSVVLDTLESFKRRFDKAGHTVQVEIPDELTLFGDPGKVHQIMSNLIDNSLKHGFVDPGRSGTISINAVERDSNIILTYRDDGIGLTEEARQYLFEPFFTTARSSGGAGIGMYIVYNLVTDGLGGNIDVDSEEKDGLSLMLKWPIRSSKTL